MKPQPSVICIFIVICAAAWVIGCWIANFVKLTQCDFEAPYKGEAIHAIGLIPVASTLTVWNDDK
jgi:hypothetical protein